MAVEPLTEEQAAEGLRRLGDRKGAEQAGELEAELALAGRLAEVNSKLEQHEMRRLMLSTQLGIHNDLVHSGQDGTMSPGDIRKAADELEAILGATKQLAAERRDIVRRLPASDLDPSGRYGAAIAGAPDLSGAVDGQWVDQPGEDARLSDRLDAYGFDPTAEDVGFRPRTTPVDALSPKVERAFAATDARGATRPEPIPGRTQEQIDANEQAARDAVGTPTLRRLDWPGPISCIGPAPVIDPSKAEDAGLSSLVLALEEECRRLRYESETRRQALVQAEADLREARRQLAGRDPQVGQG